MSIIKSKINGITTMYSNPDPFEKGIIELSTKEVNYMQGLVGYLHSENPEDPNKLYIKFQPNPTNPIYPDQKGGVNLKEFINFLQNLYEEECKARGIKE